MRRKTIVISALVLCFALMFTACAARRPLQTPVQPGQDITGNRGTNTGEYTGIGPSTTNPTDTGYGMNRMGTPSYYGGYGGYGGYNNGMYGGYGNDYRNIGGGNNSPNFGSNNTGLNNKGSVTTQGERLARSCETVRGVDSATCVISGDTCYVGVDTDGDLTGRNIVNGNANNLPALKRQCAQKIKAANPQIKRIYVSTDANFFERLRRISDGTGNGNARDNSRNELIELVRDMIPERL